jgi:phosphoglycolate phosphatase
VTSGHVVFLDLDGTILDSAPGIVAGLREAYAAAGMHPPDDGVLRSWIGPPVINTLTRELGPRGDDVVKAANRGFRDYFDAIGAYQSEPYAGIPASMESMSAVAALVVVTHKPRSLAEIALSQHGLSDLVTSVHAPPGPTEFIPKEDLFAEAICAACPQTAIAAGDRGSDVHAASAHGIPSIGVTWGYGSAQELRSAGAVALATTPRELCALTAPGSARA